MYGLDGVEKTSKCGMDLLVRRPPSLGEKLRDACHHVLIRDAQCLVPALAPGYCKCIQRKRHGVLIVWRWRVSGFNFVNVPCDSEGLRSLEETFSALEESAFWSMSVPRLGQRKLREQRGRGVLELPHWSASEKCRRK